MQDQVSCIELARVCQEEPEQLEAHKKGIALARNKRLEEIEQSLNALGGQLEAKAGIVGGKVLLNPYSSPHAIANIESITSDLNTFASTLQLEHIHLHVENGPTWIQAAGKAVDDTGKALQNAGQQTAHAVQNAGQKTMQAVQNVKKTIKESAQNTGDNTTDEYQAANVDARTETQQQSNKFPGKLKQLPEIKLPKFKRSKK